MSKPTREGALLLLQLIGIWNQNENTGKAWDWLLNDLDIKTWDEFIAKYPKGSQGYKNLTHILSNWEIVSTFVNNELISDHLVFDLWGPLFWPKLGPLVKGLRNFLGDARYYENYEYLANKFQKWAEDHPPKV